LTNQERSLFVFEEMARQGLRCIYEGGIYTSFCSERHIDALAEVCDRVYLVIERKENAQIQKYQRSTQESLDEAQLRLLERLKEKGVAVSAYFVIGHPAETEQSMLATIDFARELKAAHLMDYACFHVATAYQGTPLYDAMHSQGRLLLPQAITPREYSGFSASVGNILHPTVPRERIQEMLVTARREVNGSALYEKERRTLDRYQ
jgi:radical SAM superfamily enzyme YgiQ (UPF0313 family)